MDDLQTLVIPLLAEQWYDLGLELLDPVNKDFLDDMRKTDVQEHCRVLLSKLVGRDGSWLYLIGAIRTFSLNNAKSIESLLIQGELLL